MMHKFRMNSKDLFKILCNKRGQELHANYMKRFSQKKSCVGLMLHFAPETDMNPHNFESSQRIFFFNFAQ